MAAGNSSARLKAALAIGTHPEPGFVDVLVARCAIEPDFFVRDMLTWALPVSRRRSRFRSCALSAWRAAVVLVPDGEKEALAAELAAQFGRGDREVRLSLSRTLFALGDVVEPVLRTAMTRHDPTVRAHASATQRLLRDPDAGFDLAVDEARRVVALGPDREETTAC